MVPIGCPETLVRNYHFSPRNDPDERSSHNLNYFGGWNSLHPLRSRNKMKILNNQENCCTEQSYPTIQEEIVPRKIVHTTVFIKKHPVASE